MDIEEPGAKKQSKVQNASRDSSRDVMFRILSRLPLRDVIRFGCVSKYWLDMIRDPYFGSLHFKQSAADPMLLMLSQRTMKERILSINLISIRGPVLQVRDNAIGHIVSSRSWNLVGTCNGLLCLSSEDHQELVMVCNPVTREHTILPKPIAARPPESFGPMFGFGFDPLTKKYKVVRLFCFGRVGNAFIDFQDFQATAEVYTLGATGSWRAVQDTLHPPYGKQVYANGAVHWTVDPNCVMMGADADADVPRIVSFDVGREEFILTAQQGFGLDLCVAEIGGCLSVVDLSSRILAEVWVQKDHVAKCWDREYIIPLHEPHRLDMNFHRLICMHEDNGVLLTWLQDSLVSYESRLIRRRDLRIAGLLTWLDWEVCSGYRPSLVSLRDYPSQADDDDREAAFFVYDTELYDCFARGDVVCEKAGKCDRIVRCFLENGMLVP